MSNGGSGPLSGNRALQQAAFVIGFLVTIIITILVTVMLAAGYSLIWVFLAAAGVIVLGFGAGLVYNIIRRGTTPLAKQAATAVGELGPDDTTTSYTVSGTVGGIGLVLAILAIVLAAWFFLSRYGILPNIDIFNILPKEGIVNSLMGTSGTSWWNDSTLIIGGLALVGGIIGVIALKSPLGFALGSFVGGVIGGLGIAGVQEITDRLPFYISTVQTQLTTIIWKVR